MKKNTFNPSVLIFIFLFSSLLFIPGCHKNDKKEVFHLNGDIAKPSDRFGLPEIYGKVLTGSTNIYQLASGEIIIAMTQNDKTAPANKFILQTNKSSTYKVGISTIQNAEIMYLYDILLVNNLDNNTLTSYAVHSNQYDKTFNLIPKTISEKILITKNGFGLGYNNTPWPFLNTKIDINKSIKDFFSTTEKKTSDNPPGGGDSPCTAGGEGSTSCSITCGGGYNCSTSCESGYHSCCYCGNTPPDDYGPHCDCVKNE